MFRGWPTRRHRSSCGEAPSGALSRARKGITSPRDTRACALHRTKLYGGGRGRIRVRPVTEGLTVRFGHGRGPSGGHLVHRAGGVACPCRDRWGEVSTRMSMTGEEVAQLLYGVGFRGDDLVKMVAIGGRGIGVQPGRPSHEHRPVEDGRRLRAVPDQLHQRHSSNSATAIGMTDIAQLLEPEMNARAAYLPVRARRARSVDRGGRRLDGGRRPDLRDRSRRSPGGSRPGGGGGADRPDAG